jgi:hypothetical protein
MFHPSPQASQSIGDAYPTYLWIGSGYLHAIQNLEALYRTIYPMFRSWAPLTPDSGAKRD